MTIHQSLIDALDVLKMNIRDLSDALSNAADVNDELTLEPHPTSVLVSRSFDADVSGHPVQVQIAEPSCGRPVLPPRYQKLIDERRLMTGPAALMKKGQQRVALRDEHSNISAPLNSCLSFLESIDARRQMLMRLTSRINALQPDLRHGIRRVTIEELAVLESIHTTTVVHALRGKTCRTPAGVLPFSHWIQHLHSRRS